MVLPYAIKGGRYCRSSRSIRERQNRWCVHRLWAARSGALPAGPQAPDLEDGMK